MNDFNVGNSIIIKANNDEYISGIHNHNTDRYNKTLFGTSFIADKHWGTTIIGTITMKGIHDYYVIKSQEGKQYVFNNKYNEMSHR